MKVNMNALRAAVMSSFSLTVAVTVWSLLERGNQTLQIVHTAIATLMFLLIALYLYNSAHLASLMVHRELRVRMTVDPEAGFIEYVKTGSILFNACAGALAKSGIYVRGVQSLSALAYAQVVAAEGNSDSREGYGVTKSTLAQIGIGLSDDTGDCPVRIVLGKYDPAGTLHYTPSNAEASPCSSEADGSIGTQRAAVETAFPGDADFALTSDKITHVLTAYYVSRIYVNYIKYSRASLACALAASAALIFLRQIMYSAAVIAVWAAFILILVRQVEKRTTRMTFAMIEDYCR